MSESNLHLKLAEIAEEIGVVQKGGFNDFHKYKYVEERHVLDAVRGKLAAKRIVLLPSVTALSEREVISAKGKHSTITTLHVRFMFTDADSRETHECDWVGQGDDAGDKGVNKAATSALKYFLLKAFLIPTGEPDPEGDPKTDERASDRVGAPPRSSNGKSITLDQAHAIAIRALEVVDFARLRLAATHIAGHDVGEIDSEQDAISALKSFSPDQAKRLAEWVEKKSAATA